MAAVTSWSAKMLSIGWDQMLSKSLMDVSTLVVLVEPQLNQATASTL